MTMIKRRLPLALAAAVTVIPAAASAGEVSLNGEGIVR
ncbi:MAG TPA: SIMPL domain-containing protein, partial [Marinobacter hydrocarbonoclasticus]|nr:SIMPL domain-containing protein [Marinobacter nauticus]